MQPSHSTVVIGVFTVLEQAQKAVRELKSQNIGTSVRLVENDFSGDLNGRMDPQRKEIKPEKENGLSGFFARLFGSDGERARMKLNKDSENFFKDSYQKKHHLVIIEGCNDPLRCRQLLTSYGATIEERGSKLYEQERLQTDRREGDDITVMELREEQFSVDKERVQIGEVHLRKEIVEETRTVEMPLMHEELVIETRTLAGTSRAGVLTPTDIGDTREIRIPVSEEQIHIERTVAPREEVRISRERVMENRVISENLKHEEFRLEEEGRVNLKGKDKVKFRSPSAPDSHQPGV